MYVTANSGSIPLVAPAIIEIVPVGAIVVTVAFLVGFCQVLCVMFGILMIMIRISSK